MSDSPQILTRFEWGVKHSQGLRIETSEESARDALEWLLKGHARSRPGTLTPYLVRREVTAWEAAE